MNISNSKNMLQELQKINANNSPRLNNIPKTDNVDKNGLSFNDYLNETIEKKDKLLFSKHASMRLSSRNISLSDNQIKRVEDGVSKAGSKGINDSLVIVDNIALVVNIKNKIVVTALEKNSGDNIFTNIDGAVIV